MDTDSELLPLSALQHFVFCERQCALIHIEGLWVENRFTAEGRLMHRKVDDAGPEYRDGIRIERGIPLVSHRWGLIGKSDVVEFHPSPDTNGNGNERPFPVEYKRGRPKPDHCDLVQLTAQALCLEEMTGASVPEGAIFYGQPRRRMSVTFEADIRRETEELVCRLQAFIREGKTPTASYNRKCDQCSFLDLCMPKTCITGKSVSRYLAQASKESEGEDPW